MPTGLTKTQIDRLGERLRENNINEADLRTLDEYRRSFSPAYDTVVRALREQLRLKPTGRPAKSTRSLIEKLHRESIRLTQMQDIAGCRLVVGESIDQERVVASLVELFPSTSVVDRRQCPSFGYRAVHLVPRIEGKSIEIQVRTELQHGWAELSEKFSDVVDPAIKYGGGDAHIRGQLMRLSELVSKAEKNEEKYAVAQGLLSEVKAQVSTLPTTPRLLEGIERVEEIVTAPREQMQVNRKKIAELLRQMRLDIASRGAQ